MTGIWRTPTQAEKNDFQPISQFPQRNQLIHDRESMAVKFNARNKSKILHCKNLQELSSLKLSCPRCFSLLVDKNIIDADNFEDNYEKFQNLIFQSLDYRDRRIIGTSDREIEIILRYCCPECNPASMIPIQIYILSKETFADEGNLELFSLIKNKAKSNSGAEVEHETKNEVSA